ncbi:oligosaccharide flippase family protein, partial [candidate division KSB1 bacterium]|nr:oligosaccharide flippase family protein [candidate division KSB1 bacterium]
MRLNLSLPQRVAKNTGVIFFGQILTLVINLIITIYLARYLGEENYGLFSFAIVFINLFAIFTNFGMKPIIIREISSKKEIADKILGVSLMVKILLAAASIALSIICAVLIGYERELVILIAIHSFNIIVSHKLVTFRFLFEAGFESELAMQKPILFRVLDALLMISFIFILVQLSASLQTITVFYVLASLPGFILTVWFSIRHFPIKPNFNVHLIKWLFKESWPLAVYVALNALVLNIDV